RNTDAKKIIDYLYTKPIIDVAQVEKLINKSNVSSYKLISDLERLQILKEVTGGQRGRLYLFKDYLDLFQNTNE
ncbi:MAG TPA: Fic family protein, partial [Chitinophagales bacterium]|nr:Fic family protein [Chitinophagales bacterium]